MKILVIQNRMGIGDMVIFIPYIEAISKKFNSPVTLLTKESSKAKEYLSNSNNIEEIIDLKRNSNDDQHQGLIGFFRLIQDLKKFNFDKAFIFNSSVRYNLACKFSGVKKIYQYPLLKKRKQHIVDAAKNLLKKINLQVENNPTIYVDENLVIGAKKKFNINDRQINILLGIGGSGPTKSIDLGIDFRSVFRVASKTLVFEILRGSGCRFILEGAILGPRRDRDGAPKSAWGRFFRKPIF